MNVCEEISQSQKKQNVSILEKSTVRNNTKESDSQEYMHKLDIFMVKKRDQSCLKNSFNPEEINFDLGNPYFEFCLKPVDSNIDSYVERTKIFEKLYNENYSSYKEERKQVLSLFFRNPFDFSAASLPNGLENDTDSFVESATIGEERQQEAIQLKSTAENIVSKKRKHEEELFDSSMLKECDPAGKNILFNTGKEYCWENPYFEYILKSEDSNPNLYLNENSEGANNLISSKKEKMAEKNKKLVKNGVDIFGNHFTSKDRNKFKVICPQCTKKVPAPGFVRHLTYCIRVKIRKRTSPKNTSIIKFPTSYFLRD